MGDVDLDALLASLSEPVPGAGAPKPSPIGGFGLSGSLQSPGLSRTTNTATLGLGGGLATLPTAPTSQFGAFGALPPSTNGLGGLPQLPTGMGTLGLGGGALPPLPGTTGLGASLPPPSVSGLPSLPGSPGLGGGLGLPSLPGSPGLGGASLGGGAGLPPLPGSPGLGGAGLPPLSGSTGFPSPLGQPLGGIPSAVTAQPLGGFPSAITAQPLGGIPSAITAQPLGGFPSAITAQPLGGFPSAVTAQPLGGFPSAITAQPLGGFPSAITAQPIGGIPSAITAQPIGGIPSALPAQPIGGIPGAIRAQPLGAPAQQTPGFYVAPTEAAPTRATHTPDGRKLEFSTFSCARCQKEIMGQVLDIEGTKFHPQCFTCFQCGQPFGDAGYFLQDRLPYCSEDWHNLFAPKCYACKGTIRDSMIEAIGRKYHPEHFTCYRCGKPLHNVPYSECQGEPHCESCADIVNAIIAPPAHTCAKCKLPIYGEFLFINGQYIHPEHYLCTLCGCEFVGKTIQSYQDLLYCYECYLKMLAGVCYACEKPIVGLSKQALGRSYHHECFVCAHCRIPIGETKFWEHQGKPYCTTHYGQLYCDLCNKCQKPVLGGGATVWGKTWHPECLVCHGCEGPLPKGEFINWEQKPLCLPCFKKLPKKVQKKIDEKMRMEKKMAEKADAVAAAEHKERMKEKEAERAILRAQREEVRATTHANVVAVQKETLKTAKERKKEEKAKRKIRFS